ncbi:MAG: hypothetical protein ACOVQX_06010 [Legionella sp.]
MLPHKKVAFYGHHDIILGKKSIGSGDFIVEEEQIHNPNSSLKANNQMSNLSLALQNRQAIQAHHSLSIENNESIGSKEKHSQQPRSIDNPDHQKMGIPIKIPAKRCTHKKIDLMFNSYDEEQHYKQKQLFWAWFDQNVPIANKTNDNNCLSNDQDEKTFNMS